MVSVAAIIPAAGSGTRMGLDHPKQYHLLCGTPILVHTIRLFIHSPVIDHVVVVVPMDRVDSTTSLFQEYDLAGEHLQVVAGGRRRQDSVKAGLDALPGETDIVLVHDGARPLLHSDLIRKCTDMAIRHGAAIAAVPVKDTLKKGGADQCILHTVDRNDLWQAQTPQAAKLSPLLKGYEIAEDRDVTDEASLLELAGIAVQLVEGSETNIKITRPNDLLLAEKMLTKESAPSMRIGHGYDAHRFAEDRDLVLGGVTIPFEMGLAGHSDADVLTHALCDALLGAVGAGDIGAHFPDSDQHYANIYSIKLLEEVMHLVKKRGFSLSNGDITVVCQRPKLAPFLPRMRHILASACLVNEDQINIKATTTEKMGFTGRMEGISCHAVALLAQTEEKNA